MSAVQNFPLQSADVVPSNVTRTRILIGLTLVTVVLVALGLVMALSYAPTEAAQVRVIQYERERCGNESLLEAFVDEMSSVPSFAKYWFKSEFADGFQIPMRPLIPMKLDWGNRILQFRLLAEPFMQDPRFRVIYYLPDNPAAFRQCLEWQG